MLLYEYRVDFLAARLLFDELGLESAVHYMTLLARAHVGV
jgi:hypothetical protein